MKETGDLLLHMVFYAKLGSKFLLKRRLGYCRLSKFYLDKLISRHPHIYGDVKANVEDGKS